MKKLLPIIALIAVLAPAALAATPSPASPAQFCKSELTKIGSANFISEFAAGQSQQAAFSACVKKQNTEAAQAQQNAAKTCAAALKLNASAFMTQWGTTNSNRANAMGKCVSATAHQLHQAQQQAEVNAAAACKALKASMSAAAFKAANGGKANAFAVCVASKK